MKTKTISLTEDAYEQLESLRRADETYSDLIVRLTGGRPLAEIAGEERDDGLEEAVEEVRESLERTTKRIAAEFDRSS